MRNAKCIKAQPKPAESEWTTRPLEGGSGKGPFPLDNSDLKRRIAKNPQAVAAEAKYKLNELHKGYHRELYAVLAMIYGVARHYRFNYKDWKSFFEQPFFQTGRRKPRARKHHDQALRHTMNFVFDARSKRLRNRTGKYAAALHQYMQIGMPVHIVAEEIEKDGGIEKLYVEYLEREAARPKRGRQRLRTDEDYGELMWACDLDGKARRWPKDAATGDLDEMIGAPEDGEDELKLDANREDGKEDMLDVFDDADTMLMPQAIKRGTDPKGRPTIELEVTSVRQSRFLDMAKGRKAVVYVTCAGTTEEGWQRLRVRKVSWKRVAK